MHCVSARAGELRAYRRHGWGVFHETAGYKFEGDWLDDERAGYGREVRENGDVYEGQFVADRRHGRGRFLSLRGEEYDGSWARTCTPCMYVNACIRSCVWHVYAVHVPRA